MPLYEYKCSDCNTRFELIVNHQHADDVVCMKCQSQKVRRLLSIFAAPHGEGDFGYDDAVPSMGSCACGGNCGCH
jgi:putative FmdB family regulatory protein